MEMGEKIKSLREQKGMTLEELGNKVGVGKSTVRKWENGIIANMRRDKISKIAAALDISPAALMGWEDEAPAPSDNKSLRDEFTPHEKDVIYSYRDSDVFVQQAVDALLKIQDELEKKERLA